MSERFLDKVVLVTGGGTGIGRACAAAFADEGATVVVAGRRLEPLRQTVADIRSAGGKADCVVADVTDGTQVARLVSTTVATHGGLHVAVNNAGVMVLGRLSELSEADWARSMSVATGTWLCMKHEIAHMRVNGGGAIVNMSSIIGPHWTLQGAGGYAAMKAAVRAMTRTAALEHSRDGIRINAVSPGAIATPMSRRPGESAEEQAARVRESLPAGRVGTVTEVADAVLWLASEEAGFAVGSDLVIDGGASL
jgi:NAD(P)-dependent dehydrogenase (short-subunit alcohol dehydrogenase family)